MLHQEFKHLIQNKIRIQRGPLSMDGHTMGTLCIARDTEGPPLKTTHDKPINQSDIGLAWLSVFPHITKKK